MFSAKKHHRICGNQGVCVFYLQGLCSRSLLVHFWSARRKPTCCHHSCFWKRKARGEVRQGSLSRVICLFPSQLPSFKFFFFISVSLCHFHIHTLVKCHTLRFFSLSQFSLACSFARLLVLSRMFTQQNRFLVEHVLALLRINIFPDFLIYSPALNLVYLLSDLNAAEV